MMGPKVKDEVLSNLAVRGYSMLPPLEHAQINAVNDWLLSRPVFVDAHVPQTSRNRGEDTTIPRRSERAKASECICVHNDDVVMAPVLLETALALTDAAAAYLGRDPPVGFSMNAFWTRPGPAGSRPDIQEFHKDSDDVRFLALFFYLNNVSEADGPQDLYGPDDVCRTITGPAGTMFLADTSRLHRGRKPLVHERGLAWFRWGVSDQPPAGQWDKIEPIAADLLGGRYPSDPRLRDSIRLLVVP